MEAKTPPDPSDHEPWEIEYYTSPSGNVPVLEWLKEMSPRERALALGYIDQLALLGTEARAPLVKPLRDKLHELRWKGMDKQYRIAYCAFTGRKFVLLHGIVKKGMAWPRREMETALRRMRDYEERRS